MKKSGFWRRFAVLDTRVFDPPMMACKAQIRQKDGGRKMSATHLSALIFLPNLSSPHPVSPSSVTSRAKHRRHHKYWPPIPAFRQARAELMSASHLSAPIFLPNLSSPHPVSLSSVTSRAKHRRHHPSWPPIPTSHLASRRLRLAVKRRKRNRNLIRHASSMLSEQSSSSEREV